MNEPMNQLRAILTQILRQSNKRKLGDGMDKNCDDDLKLSSHNLTNESQKSGDSLVQLNAETLAAEGVGELDMSSISSRSSPTLSSGEDKENITGGDAWMAVKKETFKKLCDFYEKRRRLECDGGTVAADPFAVQLEHEFREAMATSAVISEFLTGFDPSTGQAANRVGQSVVGTARQSVENIDSNSLEKQAPLGNKQGKNCAFSSSSDSGIARCWSQAMFTCDDEQLMSADEVAAMLCMPPAFAKWLKEQPVDDDDPLMVMEYMSGFLRLEADLEVMKGRCYAALVEFDGCDAVDPLCDSKAVVKFRNKDIVHDIRRAMKEDLDRRPFFYCLNAYDAGNNGVGVDVTIKTWLIKCPQKDKFEVENFRFFEF